MKRKQWSGLSAAILVLVLVVAPSRAAEFPTFRVQEIDPNMPITSVRTMEEFYYGNATGIVTTLTAVSGAMGVMGLLLALVGLYGLVAYAVARRTREIGIRMAVGAPSSSVLRMVIRHGLMLSAAGVVLGVIGSVGVGGLLRGVFPSAGSSLPLNPHSTPMDRAKSRVV